MNEYNYSGVGGTFTSLLGPLKFTPDIQKT